MSIVVRGHGLVAEGAAHWPHDGQRKRWSSDNLRVGSARCACGELSAELPSTAARQRWHREHKLEVAAS